MEEGDCLYASYRDHGTALAVGSPPAAVMAELFGKETGVAHGRGGSMHLMDVQRRFFGGWGIVGAHLPIAAGTALALSYRDLPNAVLCQFGDGAVETGSFHEALNLAGIWDLPIVFQIINNQYGMGTSVEQSAAEPELWRRRRVPPRMATVDGRRPGGARATARLGEATGHAPACWRRSLPPRASVADAARSTAARRRSRAGARRDPITFGLLCRARPADGEQIEESGRRRDRGQGSPSTRALASLPRSRHALRARLRRPRLARAVLAHAGGAPFGERGEERSWQT
jgi:pyruvate dehydrogenase E1 component alpha subunit